MADSRHITRRAALSTISAVPFLAALPSSAAAEAETAGLSGLPLAAVHIERAIKAMGTPNLHGLWEVTIHSGDPEQSWGFHHIPALHREPNDDLSRNIEGFRQGLAAYNASPVTDSVHATTEEFEQVVAETYGPFLEVLKSWEKPAANRHSALEALRLAQKELEDFAASDIVPAMVSAALAYFEAHA